MPQVYVWLKRELKGCSPFLPLDVASGLGTVGVNWRPQGGRHRVPQETKETPAEAIWSLRP
jgi:hypothetical protein